MRLECKTEAICRPILREHLPDITHISGAESEWQHGRRVEAGHRSKVSKVSLTDMSPFKHLRHNNIFPKLLCLGCLCIHSVVGKSLPAGIMTSIVSCPNLKVNMLQADLCSALDVNHVQIIALHSVPRGLHHSVCSDQMQHDMGG